MQCISGGYGGLAQVVDDNIASIVHIGMVAKSCPCLWRGARARSEGLDLMDNIETRQSQIGYTALRDVPGVLAFRGACCTLHRCTRVCTDQSTLHP